MKVSFRGVAILTLGVFTAGLAWTTSGQAAAPADDDVKVAAKPAERVLRLPETPYRYVVDLPAHFKTAQARNADNTPNANPVTDAGATLGRVIFYDKRVSSTGTTACASCHHQKNAFADPTRFSKGHDGKFVDRHAPGIANVRFYGRNRFFWDERAAGLETQVLLPIQSKIEMGQTLPGLVTYVSKEPQYADLFQKAFGTKEVTKERISRALAQFVRSLVTYQSKYDEGAVKVANRNTNFPNFTAQENTGRALFMQRCANCHMQGGQAAHFFMARPLNNGLDDNVKTTDGGVGDLTFRGNEIGLFKAPSLRNVEFTGPYMHDGRFDTLEKVVDHYSTGVKQHPNLDRRVRRFNFSVAQKAALVAFMKTLSDRHFVTDPKFSDPFQ